jgi:hypothetical protein
MFERDHAVLVSKGVLEIDGVLQTHEGISVRALKARLAYRQRCPPVAGLPLRGSLQGRWSSYRMIGRGRHVADDRLEAGSLEVEA